jgi:ribonuclease HI
MVSQNLLLTFHSVEGADIGFEVSDHIRKVMVYYNREDMHFSFEGDNHLSEVLSRNQFQLEKVVKSALKGKPFPGRQIQCLFIENFPFLNNHDYNHFIRIDRRNSDPVISVSTLETKGIYKLYTDGSYAGELDRCGYAGIILDKAGDQEIFQASFSGGSSNLMELLAVTAGLERLGSVEEIQINTDSRFVIRGLTQWIHFWRLNDWQMAYGRKVSYAAQWQQIDRLSQGKLLELKWIKGHSGNINQEYCHQLAKQIATKGSQSDLLADFDMTEK